MTEVTPDNAARATPVAYTGQDELAAIAAGFSTACTFGTYSELQGRTVPVFDATTVTALEARVVELEAALRSLRDAFIFRQAVVACADAIEKIDFADNKVWKACEEAKNILTGAGAK